MATIIHQRLVRKCLLWADKSEISHLPDGLRGVYTLLKKRGNNYNVVYVGLAAGSLGIKSRLRRHKRSKTKGDLWSHFSIFEVWPNVSASDLRELEGLLREIYRKDRNANSLCKQKRFLPFQKKQVRISERNASGWEAGFRA